MSSSELRWFCRWLLSSLSLTKHSRTSLRRLGRYGIEYVEQPCRDLDDVARLRAEIDIPIAVDEGIRLADDPTSVRLQGIADYAICKPMTLGGAAATGRVAEAIGVPVVISGSLDSSIGLASCVAIAASLPDLPLASGLGTGTLFERDLVEPLEVVNVASAELRPATRPPTCSAASGSKTPRTFRISTLSAARPRCAGT